MSVKFKVPIEVDGKVSAEYLDLSTTTTRVVDAGEIAWNSIDGTFDIGLLNGVTLQAGQEMHFYGKATEAISNGNAVMFAGVQGDHILIAKADAATINANPEYFMGVATQDFTTNQFGYVTAFGNVRGLNTLSYTLGDVLYFDSTSATDGLLTATEPSAPNAKIIVAAVVRVHATQGILAVRPHTMPKLKDIQDVNVDTATTGEILQLQSTGVWENKTLSEAGIISGSGTTNYLSKFTGATTLGNSLLFDNGTNVGIGTSAPNAKLEVSAGQSFINQDYLLGWNVAGSSTLRAYIIGTSGNELQFWNRQGGTNTQAITLNASGNVGIGATAPGARLDVVGIFDALPARILRQATYGEILRIGRNGVSESASINYPADGVFAINTASTERMRVAANGNVGIGTSSPTNKLHVLGGILNGAVATFSGQNNDRGLVISTFNSGSSDAGVLLNAQTALGVLSFATVGSERMRITSSGNVGIGTSSPAYKLQVAGGIYQNDTTFISYYDGAVRFGGLNSYSTIITNTGNVGIGTASPTNRLQVEDSVNSIVASFKGAGGNAYSTFNIMTLGANGDGFWRASTIGGNIKMVSNQPAINVNGFSSSAIAFGSDANQGRIGFFTTTSNTGDTLLTEAMRIDTNGNVGIGTTSPTTLLDVRGGFNVSDGTSTVRIVNSGGVGLIGTLTTHPLAIRTDNTERMRITSAGNVGIGTTAPNARLDVQQSVDGNAPVIFANSSTGTSARNSISLGNNTGTISSIDLYGSNYNIGSTDDVANGLRILNSGAGGVAIRASNASGSIRSYIGSSEVMRVASNSNVGIGTSSPGEKLTVSGGSVGISIDGTTAARTYYNRNGSYIWSTGLRAGDTKFHIFDERSADRLVIDDSGNVGIGTSSPNSKLTIKQGVNTYQGGIRIEKSSDDTSLFLFNDGSKNIISSSYGSTGSYVPLYFQTSDLNRLIIDTNGNVGIGTSAPSERLTIKASGDGALFAIRTSYASNAAIVEAGQTASDGYLNIKDAVGNVYTSLSGYSGSPSYFLSNVGIGTTSPGSKLEVLGKVTINSSVSGDVISNTVNTSASGYGSRFQGGGGNSSLYLAAFNDYAGNAKMVIDGNGNLGIGTSNPTEKLTISGGNISLGAGYKLQYSSTAYMTPENNVSGAEIGTPGVFTIKTGGTTERVRVATTGAVRFNSYGSGSFTGTATQKLAVDSSGNIIEIPIGAGPVDGSGTTNYVTKWTDSDTIGNSIMYDNGSRVGIGSTTPAAKLEIFGGVLGSTAYDYVPTQVLNVGNSNGEAFEMGSIRTAAGSDWTTAGFRLQEKIDSTWMAYMQFNGDGNLGGMSFGTGTSATSRQSISERMRITNTGNVGIGTTTPNRLLTVAGTTSGLIALNASSYRNTTIGSDSVGNFVIYDDTAFAYRMVVNSSGNVGIGTTTPSSKLHVDGAGYSFITGYDSGNRRVYIGLDSAGEPSMQGTLSNGTARQISINPNGGNVGIGTTSPGYKLDINGDTKSTVSYVTDGTTIIRTIPSSGVGYFGTQTNHPLVFQTNSDEKMRITSAGNVGIGTTIPSARLDIVSTATGSEGLRVDGATGGFAFVVRGGSDYTSHIRAGATIGANYFTTPPSNGLIVEGNVGIGTTSPSNKLQVSTSGTALASFTGAEYSQFNIIGGSQNFYIQNYNSVSILGTKGASPLLFTTNETERMRITSDGNVGIGTSAPDFKLTVNGSAIFGATSINGNPTNDFSEFRGVGITDGTTSYGSYGGILLSANTQWTGSAKRFLVTNVLDANKFAIIRSVDAGTNPSIGTNGSLSSGTADFVINSSGNVGIGTTSPSEKLEVNGSIRLSDGNADGPQLKLASSGYSDWNLDNYNGSFRAYYGSSEYFRITGSGNVGIGTTSPSAKLDVNGDALINGLTVGRGGGNSAYNTAFGVGALSSNTSGEYNIAIGRSANNAVNISGSTVIGTDLFTSPGNSSLTSNCLVIGQYNPSNSGTQFPHIYAPDKVNCPNGNTTTDVIAVDYSVYTAIFMEYSIFNSAGDQFRAGTYTAAFKSTGTVVDDDNQTVVYSGTTLSATFTTSVTGSVATIQLRNQDSDTYDIRVTARLLMR